MKFDYRNKTILVFGLGLSGSAAARFLMQRGATVIGVDRKIDELHQLQEIKDLIKDGMQIDRDVADIDLAHVELLVLSPGISPDHDLVRKAVSMNIEIIGEIELGCRHTETPIMGISGTNGKTTVTLLVNHVLNLCGVSSLALGNVGKPFTSEIDRDDSEKEMFVLELSSYQLETMRRRILDAALLLNITPDHLDRYKNMQDYAKAKSCLGNCLKPEKPFFLEYRTFEEYRELFQDFSTQTYGYTPESVIYSDLKHVYFRGKKAFLLPDCLQGERGHELDNLMGAFALCSTKGIPGSRFIEAFKSFQKPPHRIQFIGNFQGVSYYDDSKGTNIDAVLSAVQSLQGPIILIAGGLDKGASYTPWITGFKGKVKKILVIGQASNKIRRDLSDHIPVEIVAGLEQAVLLASEQAEQGGCVLLSPGCASQDMFKDYVHRGKVFQQAVRSHMKCTIGKKTPNSG